MASSKGFIISIALPENQKKVCSVLQKEISDFCKTLKGKNCRVGILERQDKLNNENIFMRKGYFIALIDLAKRHNLKVAPLWQTALVLNYLRQGEVKLGQASMNNEKIHSVLDERYKKISLTVHQKNPGMVTRVMALLDINCCFSLENIAIQLKISPAYLSTTITKNTLCTFTNLVNTGKVLSAINQFLNSMPVISLEETSISLGFASIHYFNKVFKKYSGVTPGWVKKQIENMNS